MQKKQNTAFQKSKHIALSICLLFLVHIIYAQEPTYIHFEPEIDIPFSTTYGDIVQDSLGYIWFGTDSGLYRYDGEVFERIPAASTIKDIEVLDLKMEAAGTLWYQTLDGHICYFTQGNDSINIYSPNGVLDTLTTLSFKLQHHKLFVKSKEKNSPTIWLYSFNTKSKQPKAQRICSAPGVFKFSFQNDTLLFPNNYSPAVKNIANLKLRFVPKLNGDGINFVYNQNQTALAYNKNEIRSLSDSSKTIKTDSFVINNWLYKDSIIWFATNKGILKVDSKLNQKISFTPFNHQNIYSLLIDRQNSLWVGTYGNGVFYLPANSLYDYNTSIPDGIIKILRADFGSYIILSKNSISMLSAQTLAPEKNPLFLSDRILDGYLEKNILYIRTLRNLTTYSIHSSGKKIRLISKRQMAGKQVRPIGKNRYISGAYLSLKEITDNNYQTLSTQRITALYKDSLTQSIWVGGYNGVEVWQYNLRKVKANPNIRPAIKSPITMIEKAQNNHIWISSSTKGLFDFYNNTTINYPFKINNKSKRIDQISCNSPTKIWISSYNELYFFDKENKKYGYIHDVSKIIKSPITSLYATNDTIFIGTKKGLFLYFPNQTITQTNPLVGIESVKINFNDTLILPSYNLSYAQNNIELKFNTIGSFNPLYKSEISYKLNETDHWHRVHNKRLSLVNLAPDTYNIIIKSVFQNNSSKFNTKTLHITISKPFWKTAWFYSLTLISCSLIIFYWFYNKKKQLELARQRDLESEKLKNAVLQLQMNPHFIFNSMNTIIYYITIANKEKSIQILTKLSRLIRQIFVFSNKNLIPLSTELQFLSDYLDMEQERFAEKVEIIRMIEQKALESNFPIPPLMVQPIIENSFKHGLFHKKEQGTLRFSAFLIKNGISFVIEDDGVGRSYNHKPASPHKKTSSYDVISNRIQLINQSTEEFSDIFVQFEVLDLIDSQKNPIGTKSTITFEQKHK